jgi:D-alanine-D-alanine ligase-like ATP-grasp enzyme
VGIPAADIAAEVRASTRRAADRATAAVAAAPRTRVVADTIVDFDLALGEINLLAGMVHISVPHPAPVSANFANEF